MKCNQTFIHGYVGGLDCKEKVIVEPTYPTYPVLRQVFSHSSALPCLCVIKAYDTGEIIEDMVDMVAGNIALPVPAAHRVAVAL